MNEHIVDLIHQELDGVNTAEQSARLRGFLAWDAEARRLYDDLASMAEMLTRVESVAPPPDLKDAVMATLYARESPAPVNRHASARTAGRLKAFLRELRTALETRLAGPRLAYAFCLGLVAGMAVYALLVSVLQPTDPASSDLYGALVPRTAVGRVEDAYAAPIEGEAVQGNVLVAAVPGGLVSVALDLRAEAPVAVQLSFDPEALSLQGFTRQEAPPADPVAAGAGQVRFGAAGEGSFYVVFHRRSAAEAQLHLRLLRAEQVLYEQALRTP